MYQSFKKLRTNILIWLTHNMALPLLQRFRNEKKFPHSTQELSSFPTGTLGNDLYSFLEDKQLELLPHYARHDLKHILLQYDTTESGEVCLQCFMLGNGHISFPVMATVLYGIFTMPEYYSLFKIAFRRGKNCREISEWNWYELLHSDTKNLQLLIAEK